MNTLYLLSFWDMESNNQVSSNADLTSEAMKNLSHQTNRISESVLEIQVMLDIAKERGISLEWQGVKDAFGHFVYPNEGENVLVQMVATMNWLKTALFQQGVLVSAEDLLKRTKDSVESLVKV